MKSNKKIYVKIIDILAKKPLSRRDIIKAYIASLGLPREVLADHSTSGRVNIERSIAI